MNVKLSEKIKSPSVRSDLKIEFKFVFKTHF